MRIKKLQLQNFKRFTDLTINLDKSYKLVLLVGSNGSGKSSVFDAFEVVSSNEKKSKTIFERAYHAKNQKKDFSISIETEERLFGLNSDNQVVTPISLDQQNAFYGRSSLRQVPKLERLSLGKNTINFEQDSDRPRQFIDRDERFENDIEHITAQILQAVFNSDSNTKKIRDTFINEINQSFERIFGTDTAISLRLKQIIPPLEGNIANISFQKGDSEIHYNFN
jgi:DNA repair exonuclease SbcCD ATPase subunit